MDRLLREESDVRAIGAAASTMGGLTAFGGLFALLLVGGPGASPMWLAASPVVIGLFLAFVGSALGRLEAWARPAYLFVAVVIMGSILFGLLANGSRPVTLLIAGAPPTVWFLLSLWALYRETAGWLFAPEYAERHFIGGAPPASGVRSFFYIGPIVWLLTGCGMVPLAQLLPLRFT